ncbi:MAG: hypothetical protein FJ218_09310 [Ignavibacteria bacterium]|nr:hypothetical protein [Ignavibacteria bacterium]
MHAQRFFLFAIFHFFISGCSLTTFVSYSVSGFIENTFIAVNEESDLKIAETSILSNLKLLDGLLKSTPDNEQYLLLASQGYAGYALGFVEDEEPQRAKDLYLRAKNYAQKILRKKKSFHHELDGSVEDFQTALHQSTNDDVPAIFWTALNWGSYVYLDLANPDAIASLSKIEAMMKFVAEKDSAYYFSGANFFLGALYGSRPAILGGDMNKSKQYFETALRINGGKFLLTQIYYAKYYCVQTQNQELFEQLLSTVENASLDIFPEQKLTNAIAKKKAILLRNKINDLF